MSESTVENVVTERLKDAIDHVAEWVEAGETFAGEQIPLLVPEILYWEVASRAFYLAIGIAILSATIFCYRNARRKWTSWGKRDFDGEEFCKFSSVLGVIMGLTIGILVITSNFMGMLMPLIAPRLYLIEYFQHLVN